MIDLTEEQLRSLADFREFPPQVRDPRNNVVYVLIHSSMFERVRATLEEEDDIADINGWLRLSSEVLEADDAEDPTSKESA